MPVETIFPPRRSLQNIRPQAPASVRRWPRRTSSRPKSEQQRKVKLHLPRSVWTRKPRNHRKHRSSRRTPQASLRITTTKMTLKPPRTRPTAHHRTLMRANKKKEVPPVTVASKRKTSRARYMLMPPLLSPSPACLSYLLPLLLLTRAFVL